MKGTAKPDLHPGLPSELRGRKQIHEGEQFSFGCHPGVPCFNTCCRDVNILLTPVDILRLSRRLQVSTTNFLEQHTLTPITKELHLPVKLLRMRDEPEKRCPFVGPEGCTVYAERPWACRMYPLGMAIPPARAGVEPAPVFFISQDDFCHGRQQESSWTIDEWRENQGAKIQEAVELGYQEIVSHPWFIGGRQLDSKRIEMFHSACYDLDSFRRFVFDSTFLERFELEDELIAKLRSDDESLLRFAFRWLRFALFAEPTLKVREKAKTERKS